MIKKILTLLLLLQIVYAQECSPYFKPDRFYKAPEYLIEFLKEHLPTEIIFSNKSIFDKREFIKKKNIYIKKESFVQQGDYLYPLKTGVWKYTTKNKVIDELNISRAEIYRFKDEDIANSINDDFENFWLDFIEDGYSMQLTPEQTLFRYNGEYFTFSVFIYGVQGDATPLKGTVVNFWLKNYTKEVNEYIKCNLKKENNNGS